MARIKVVPPLMLRPFGRRILPLPLWAWLLFPAAFLILFLRFFGLPAGLTQKILNQLEGKGISLTAKRVLLSPLGAFILEDVVLWQDREHRVALLRVDHLKLGWVWESVRSGKWALRSVTVRNGSVRWPLGPSQELELNKVFAKAEVLPDRIELLQGEALLFGKCHLSARGTFTLEGTQGLPWKGIFGSGRPEAAQQGLGETLTRFFNSLSVSEPLQARLDFQCPLQAPLAGRARLSAWGSRFHYRGVAIRSFSLGLRLQSPLLELSKLRVEPERGYLEAQGRVELSTLQGGLQFYSEVDPTEWAVLLPGEIARWVRQFRFPELAALEGKIQSQATRETPFYWEIQAKLKRFWLGTTLWEKAEFSASSDRQRVFVPEATLAGNEGQATLSLFRPARTAPWQGHLKASFNPQAFQGLSSGLDRVLGEWKFASGKPLIEADFRVNPEDLEDSEAKGKLEASSFSYKGVFVLSAKSAFSYQDRRLTLRDFRVVRPEGSIEGTIEEDFRARQVNLHKLRSTVKVQEVAPAIGQKFPRYVQPYRFTAPPRLLLDGVVDLDERKAQPATHLAIELESPAIMDYDFLGKTIHPSNIVARILILGRKLVVQVEQARLFEGSLRGTIQVELVEEPTFQSSFELLGADFQKVLITYFQYDKSTGRMDLRGEVGGVLGKLATLKGRGTCEIHGGYLMDIPFLGGLFSLLGQAIPLLNISSAGDAQCDFDISQGAVWTQKLKVTSPVLAMIGQGKYDYLHDSLDLDMRVNFRGPASVLFFPVSKLFEYHGRGPLKNPKWEMKLF
jgi:hypothetical protein